MGNNTLALDLDGSPLVDRSTQGAGFPRIMNTTVGHSAHLRCKARSHPDANTLHYAYSYSICYHHTYCDTYAYGDSDTDDSAYRQHPARHRA